MWNDTDFDMDMEELEARLYGQVHHPATEEFTQSSFNNFYRPNSNVNNNSQDDFTNTNNMFKNRYFNDRQQEPMNSFNRNNNFGRNNYQQSTFFRKSQQSPFQNLPNYYNPLGYIPEIALNNIVVLQQPPAATSTPSRNSTYRQQQQQQDDEREQSRRQRQREKRKARRQKKRSREGKKPFREHRLRPNPLNAQISESNRKKTKTDSVICLSESDNNDSDCELMEKTLEPAIEVSSDDEDAEIDVENDDDSSSSNVKDENCLQSDSKLLSLGSETKDEEENNDSDDDDDVVLIEPKPPEIIEINCDDTLTSEINEIYQEISDLDASKTNKNEDFNRIETNRSNTPESTTNDFLIDVGDDVNLIPSSSNNEHSSNFQNVSACETESTTSSASERPNQSSKFIEPEFDVPHQHTLSELTLDSFADYIGSANNDNSSSNIFNKNNRSKSSAAQKRTGKNKSNSKNSSDSSSESDYEQDKVSLITNKSKKRLRTQASSEASENDCFIVGDQVASLPNLSPITSGEELEEDNAKSPNKNRKKNKKNKKKAIDSNTSGSKRKYPKEVVDYIKAKKAKESGKTIEKADPSSDELSEVEVVDSFKADDIRTSSPIELINVSDATVVAEKTIDESGPQKIGASFMDYWTDDMQKFYFESWGDEEFSVEKVQTAMSDSPDLWKIIPDDRTFNKSQPRGARCNRCNEFGHKVSACKAKYKPLKCNICAGLGHFYTRCPNAICTTCGRRSYSFTTCCRRCVNSHRTICRICSRSGHDEYNCPDIWRRYHLTTQPGPLTKPFDFNLKTRKERWCSGCASQGHFEFECNYYNRTHNPSNPIVCSYDNIYRNNNFSISFTNERCDRTTSDTTTNNERIPLITVTNHMQMQTPSSNEQTFVSATDNAQMQTINEQSSPSCSFSGNNAFTNDISPALISSYNFNQQFPVYQSLPNVSQNSNLFNNPSINIPSLLSLPLLPLPQQQNIDGNAFSYEQQLMNTQLKNGIAPEAALVSANSENYVKYVNIDNFHQEIFRCKEGEDFLNEVCASCNVIVSDATKQTSKHIISFRLEGSQQAISSAETKILDFVDNFEKSPLQIALGVLQARSFTMRNLRNCIAYLQDDQVDWKSVAVELYEDVKRHESLKASSCDNRERSAVMKKLKQRYAALNAILIWKTGIDDGGKYVSHLKKFKPNKAFPGSNIKIFKTNYCKIFRRYDKLQMVDYQSVISHFGRVEGLLLEFEELFKIAVALCAKNKLTKLGVRLNTVYRNAKRSNFAEKYVGHFRKLCKIINTKDSLIHK